MPKEGSRINGNTQVPKLCCFYLSRTKPQMIIHGREVSTYNFYCIFFILYKFDVVFDTLASRKLILARQLPKYV